MLSSISPPAKIISSPETFARCMQRHQLANALRAESLRHRYQQSHCTRRRRRHFSPMWKAERPASSSSYRIRLQRTCRQHVIPIGTSHQTWITRGVSSRCPLSALTQIQVFPRLHTRHTCPHDPKDLPSHARTDGICRAPPRSVLSTE